VDDPSEALGFLYAHAIRCAACAWNRPPVRVIRRASLHRDVKLVCERCGRWIGGDDEVYSTARHRLRHESSCLEALTVPPRRTPLDALVFAPDTNLRDVRDEVYRAALRRHGNRKAPAARSIGVSRKAMYDWCARQAGPKQPR